MRLLLDTNILVPLIDGNGRNLPEPVIRALEDDDASLWASVASIWEVAIKHRLGKLPLPCPLPDWPAALTRLNISALPVSAAHVIRDVDPWPVTKDPFDRLLLAICAAEQMQFVTTDGALVDHPLAWRPTAA